MDIISLQFIWPTFPKISTSPPEEPDGGGSSNRPTTTSSTTTTYDYLGRLITIRKSVIIYTQKGATVIAYEPLPSTIVVSSNISAIDKNTTVSNNGRQVNSIKKETKTKKGAKVISDSQITKTSRGIIVDNR